MRARVIAATAMLACLLAPRSSAADDRHHVRVVHRIAAASLFAAFVVEQGFSQDINPTSCRWCSPDSLDTSIRDALVWQDRARADSLSNYTAFATGLIPAAVVAIGALGASADDDRLAHALDDAVPIVEAWSIAELAVEGIKITVARERPGIRFHALPSQYDDNESFISGHSAFAFSLATSAGVVAHERRMAIEPYVWAVGMTLATATGYLRIAADKHYFTDVVGGAALGAAAGIFVPRWTASLREPTARATMVVPTPGGVAIVGRF